VDTTRAFASLIIFFSPQREELIMSTHNRDEKVDGTLNRREFFQRAAVLGAMAAGAGSLLAACKKGNGGAGTSGGDGNQAGGGGGGGGGGAGGANQAGEALSCMDTTNLTPAQIKVRKSLNYTDESPKPEQLCSNCQHFKPAGGGGCGGCAVVPGPIHPDGWCSTWVAAS
jgi:hypothetical protein